MALKLYKKINAFCKALEKEFPLISPKRKMELAQLSEYIFDKIEAGEKVKLVAICTHNSRRSHMAQIWLADSSDFYQIKKIKSYSGGTQSTSFYKTAIKAMKKAGFKVKKKKDGKNPNYFIQWSKIVAPQKTFSKKYSHKTNPDKKFAAIMVCDSADEACPIIFGADFRLSLPYQDPKKYDGTKEASKMYSERSRQIGREMLFIMKLVKNQLH